MKPMLDRVWAWQNRNAPYFFLLPFVLLFCGFMVYPLARSAILSFYKSGGPGHQVFIGLGNYTFLFQDDLFWKAVANTVTFTVCFIGLQIPLALGLALLLNSKLVRCRNFLRYAFFSTNLVGNVFASVVFFLLLAPRSGLVNRFIGAVTPFGVETHWLGSPALAMPALILASLWLSVGYAMIYFLAALQSVDTELYEAAQMDGAGKVAQFWHVTLPGIRPVLTFIALFGAIGAFQLFELPYVLFQGPGPNNSALTIVMYLFNQGFEVGDIGYGAAIGWALVAMILVISIAQMRLSRPR
jgi:ABC-type sugar transport system permease subunit